MKDLSLLLTVAALASGASAVTTLLLSPDSSAASENEAAGVVGTSTAELLTRLEALEARNAELVAQVAARPLAVPAADTGANPAAVDAAVARWLEEHADEWNAAPEVAAAADGLGGSEEDILARTSMEELLDLVLDTTLSGNERQELWNRLAKAGRLDEVVKGLEAMVALDPQNPDLRVSLGSAYLQQLFHAGSGPLAGVLATKADAAFDAALGLDDTHWEARFTKAISLSNWPAFLGKQGEAIQQFETLIAQQEAGNPQPEHAQTYLFLGNMYLETGAADEALATWRRGLERFPSVEELRRQIALAEQGGGR